MAADRYDTTRMWAFSASCALLASLVSMAAWSTCLNPLPPPNVPVFHSNPGALRIVYLDFDGYCEDNYLVRGLPAETWPPFDTSSDPNAIRDIWERVAEDFAPFDVDVTTQYPSNMGEHFFWDSDAGERLSGIRVVITGADLLTGHGRSPEHPLPYNVAYVDQFARQSGVLQRRSNRAVAQTVSHELGHTFSFYLSDVTGASLGLSHYTLPRHNLTAQHKTPILGLAANERDIWWKDSMVAVVGENGAVVHRPQEDMMVLWAATDFRADDHRDEAGLATPLVSSGGATSLAGRGIVTMNAASFPSSCAIWGDPAHPVCYFWRQAHGPQPGLLDDEDFFRFRTANAGTFEVRALTINNPGSDFTRANLDAEIELWRKPAGGAWTRLPSTAFTRLSLPDDLSVGISVTESSASGAEYAVAIKSAGRYGDLGQYSVTATGPVVREAIQNVRLDDPKVPAYDEAKVQFGETDSAWFRISPTEPGTLTITADGFYGYDGGYAELALYDSAMRPVTMVKGADARIDQPVTTRETYLLRVSGRKTSGRVTFQLTNGK
jgi:hypothetical protein